MQSHLQFVLIAPTTAFATLWSIQWLAFDIAFDSWKRHFDDDDNDDDGVDDDDDNNHDDDDIGFWYPGNCPAALVTTTDYGEDEEDDEDNWKVSIYNYYDDW